MANQSSDSDDSEKKGSIPTRLFDYVLLTASLAFAEEFHIDCERRLASENETEVRAIIVAQRSIVSELGELESRVASIQRSLVVAVLDSESHAVVQAYAMLDIRRISVALTRVHRHLLTLYPVVTGGLIEQARSFQTRLDSAFAAGFDAHSDWLSDRLQETLVLSDAIRSEIA